MTDEKQPNPDTALAEALEAAPVPGLPIVLMDKGLCGTMQPNYFMQRGFHVVKTTDIGLAEAPAHRINQFAMKHNLMLVTSRPLEGSTNQLPFTIYLKLTHTDYAVPNLTAATVAQWRRDPHNRFISVNGSGSVSKQRSKMLLPRMRRTGNVGDSLDPVPTVQAPVVQAPQLHVTARSEFKAPKSLVPGDAQIAEVTPEEQAAIMRSIPEGTLAIMADENVKQAERDKLAHRGFYVIDCRRFGFEGKADPLLARFAHENGLILYTHDGDFLDSRVFPRDVMPFTIHTPDYKPADPTWHKVLNDILPERILALMKDDPSIRIMVVGKDGHPIYGAASQPWSIRSVNAPSFERSRAP